MSKQARKTFKNTMDYARWRRDMIKEIAEKVYGETLARADVEYGEILKSAKKTYMEAEG